MDPENTQLGQMFIVCYDDQEALCVPMVWDETCDGAICCEVTKTDNVAIFTSRKSARKAITISAKWNALLKAQGKIHNEDFEGESRKNLRIMPCTTN